MSVRPQLAPLFGSRLLSLGVALALIVPLFWTASTSPAVARQDAPTDPPRPAIPARYLDQAVTWSPCSFDAAVKAVYPAAPTTNCASITVPMDWQQPDAHPDIKVAIAYSKATGTSLGLMATNPGGPGAPGLTNSAALALNKQQLFTDYDLVGFDPRGFGASTPLQCVTTAEEVKALPTTPDHRERTAQTHAAEVAEARLVAKACSSTEFSQFVSSQQTVYDLEFIRALLKSRQLNFIGYSYGTWLGGWYADTYPSRVGRFVLDSNMDFTRTQWQNGKLDPLSGQRRRDTQLFPWIARHADQIEGLGNRRGKVRAKYESVRSSLVALVKSTNSTVRGDGLDGNVYSAIYSNQRFIRATLDILVHDEYVRAPSKSGKIESSHVERAWARLAPELQVFDTLSAIRARYSVTAPAPADTVSTLDTIVRDAQAAAAQSTEPDQSINLGAVGTTVRCNDTAWRKDPEYYLRQADQMTTKYPFFGYVNGVPFCAFWKFEPQDRKIDLRRSPRVLMIQSELDPATAYEGAARTHRALAKRSRLVSVDDEGQHGQYISGPSACVQDIGDRFVFTGELPARDRVCGTAPLPAESSVFPVDGPVDGVEVRVQESVRIPAQDRSHRMLQRVLDQAAATQW